MALTAKQRAFIAAYAGNGTEAARIAGYSGDDATLAQVAHENLRKPEIAEALEARETKRNNKRILTREQRQAFWSSVVDDEEQNMLSRLKASELLGRSEADFVERQRHEGSINMRVVSPYPTEGDE